MNPTVSSSEMEYELYNEIMLIERLIISTGFSIILVKTIISLRAHDTHIMIYFSLDSENNLQWLLYTFNKTAKQKNMNIDNDKKCMTIEGM